MSFDSRESSQEQGAPFEMYLFQTQTRTWRLTNSFESQTYLDQVYTPEAISRTSTSQDREIKNARTKVSIPKEHEIAQMFVPYIPDTPLSLVVYAQHEGDSDVRVTFTGRVLTAMFGDVCELQCAPESELLKRKLFQPSFQRPCNRLLYSPACGVNRADFAESIDIATVSSDGLTIVSTDFGTFDDGYFNNGYLERGVERRMIVNHVAETITLLAGLSGLAPGDTVTAFPGCRRDYDNCGKFNLANPGVVRGQYLGWDFIPIKNPFNGGIL